MAKKILVVEDSQETQYLVFELLNMSDYEVHPAMDGMEDLDMMETAHPDLIIMGRISSQNRSTWTSSLLKSKI